MTAGVPSQWTAVRAIFEEVADLPAGDRAAALAARCAGDRALQAAVERLLRADTDAAAVLTPQRVIAGLAEPNDPLGSAHGDVRVAGFHVRRLIGTGGMGAVYEAEQSEPRRLVALKVLRPELCTGSMLRRFQVEAEILARLQHPGIAEIFAAGVHKVDAGPFRWDLPWYAMELLADAQPITAYARHHRLSLQRRLQLFHQVCAAVHHAHLHGVIHRDLKPDNVLVDAAGRPKVIDFGVARAVDRDVQSTATHTRAGVQVGTPASMAPEQVAGAGDIDVRCDVWALGVLLYELLCDRVPYAPAAATQAPADVFLAQPPSPRRLRPEVTAELEWIVFKALAVERERRYQTVTDLADDLDRLGRHEPVRAAPPSAAYHLRKAIRRHRTLSATLAASLVWLLAGLWSTSAALRRARDAEAAARHAERDAHAAAERAQAEKERADAARTEAEANAIRADSARQSSAAMLDILQGAVTAASRREGGRDMTLTQLFEQMAARAESSDTMAPLMRAAAFNYLGAMSFYAGDYPTAERHLERSLELLTESGNLGGREELSAHSSLSEALRLQGHYDASEASLERAVALARATLPEDDAQMLMLKRRRGSVLLNRGRTAEAVQNSREILAARLMRGGPDSSEAAEAQLDLAAALLATGDHAACEAAAAASHAACRKAFGADSERTAHAANLWAQALVALGRTAEAEALLQAAETEALAGLPPSHPSVRFLRRVRAITLRKKGDLPAAIALFEECLASAQGATATEPREVLGTAVGLCATLLAAGDGRRAAEVAQTYAIDRPHAPAVEQQEFLRLRLEHARALRALGRADEASALLAAAEQRAVAQLGDQHPVTRDLRAERVRAR